tara:strand:+ start:38604 stop:39206 length:603 start_codon:yes stop_codon:yes gene_type:complete
VLPCPSLALEIGPYIVLGSEPSVLVGGIDGIRPGQSGPGPGQALRLEDGILEPVALMEGIEVQVLYEADAVDLELIDLCPELNGLYFLAAHDRPEIILADTYDTPCRFFTGMEDPVLLFVYLSYRCPAPMVPLRHSESTALFQFVQLAIDLVKEQKEAAVQPGPFRPGLAPHLAVGDVAPFPFQIFGPRGLYAQGLTDRL